MFCPKCKHQIFDGLLCCPVCGADVTGGESAEASGIPDERTDGIDDSRSAEAPYQPEEETDQQPFFVYDEAQQAYIFYETQPAPVEAPVSRPGALRLTRIGRILSIILSSALAALGSIYIVLDLNVFDADLSFMPFKLFPVISFPAIIMIFIFSLMKDKVKPVFFGIPLAMIVFAFIMQNLNSYFALLGVSSVALFFVTLSISSNPKALRIVTSLVFAALICLTFFGFIYEISRNISVYSSNETAPKAFYTIIHMLVYMLMIIIVLARRPDGGRPEQSGAVR